MELITTTGIASAGLLFKALHTIRGGAKTVGDVGKGLADIGGQRSLTDIVRMARVEPLTVVDADVQHWEGITEVLQTTLSVFTGYYLQAVAIMGSIDSVKVVKTLSQLNPNKAVFESYREQYGQVEDGTYKQSMEAYRWALPKLSMEALAPKDTESVYVNARISDKENVGDILRENTNLSVGKLINVTLSDSEYKSKVVLPISVRLTVNTLPSKAVESILTADNRDHTMIERFHAWRSGRIEFWRDLVLCQDMIDERKRLLMKDKAGVYSAMINVATKNTSSVILNKLTGGKSGSPSLASSSNIVVISDTTLKEIENKLGTKLSDFRTRTKIFESGYMMLLVVIDKHFDRVTFYHRGVNLPTTMGLRDMKISNKNSGPDILDIMKAMGQNSAPSF